MRLGAVNACAPLDSENKREEDVIEKHIAVMATATTA